MERAEPVRPCELLHMSRRSRIFSSQAPADSSHHTGFALVSLLVTMHWFLLLLLVSLTAPFLRFDSCPPLRLPHAIPIEHLKT